MDAGVRQAWKDVVFLFYLVLASNGLSFEHERPLLLGRLLLLEKAWHLRDQVTSRGTAWARLEQSAKGFVRLSDSFFAEALALRATFATISARYFDGDPVLFPDSETRLAEDIEQLEDLVLLHNEDMVPRLPKRKQK